MASLSLKHIFKVYDGSVKAVNDFCMDIEDKEFIVFVGPSGCGKTSLLRLLSGLLLPDSGNVTRETDRISYLFQDTALLPWLTVLENVNLVLSDGKQTIDEAREWLSLVGLSEDTERYPYELSGGMRQRVALARALCTDADLLLLDEPFRGLDDALREQMRHLIHTVRHGKTTVIVTHDKQDLSITHACIRFDGESGIPTIDKL